jgi:hypothetical protein
MKSSRRWSEAAPEWLDGGLTVAVLADQHAYSGGALYLPNYTEAGVALGSNKRADSVRSYPQGSVSYLFS